MKIIGCDFNLAASRWRFSMPRREIRERRLRHDNGEAERFYRELAAPPPIGMEAMATRWSWPRPSRSGATNLS